MVNVKNIYLFFGEDDFSLKRKIELWKAEFAKKYSPQAVVFFDAAEFSELDLISKLTAELAPSLFSAKKLLIVRDGLPKKTEPARLASESVAGRQEKLAEFLLKLPQITPKDFFIVFWQTSKMDGRVKFFKQFVSLVNVTEFNLPHGQALNTWIKATSQTLDVRITDEAVDLLAQYLGRDLFEEKKFGGKVVDRKEAYNLWQVYSELSKLASSTTDPISPDLVKSLVKPKLPDSVFNLSDNLALHNQEAAFQSLENYLETATGDEKSAFIKITGLLAEQFRSLLLINLLQAKQLTNAQIAEKLGWSSGRVFILTKHSKNFSKASLIKLLGQLLVVDQKIKSTDANPRLLLDMFIQHQF
ncbi:MAG: hypothetical protein A3B10_03805 [Candidatus Doudnabacteria bacterium RIFCSPLOWO2_01_FULL_44_21]|uniref:DNA-directed DNA polymerase n=1 Tax=Candidatus Doudnabacteria bacterium RIFCSPLOWO2_01_FULL_44_21 TaxID=1817841 RepID=A0A1F5PY83_9BACT|nr:MAG: hypothetical protein A3B95_02040 [Candidatus Doudnabacteria bacterium RIFCSPHIGHO2_02_FULL_43_13b]OGE94885.1 MAG: hypothetical protein A3B10_03805 [Candidatus Doudnabacteria bacterium RIFCSPLOWO2_01_FULL_44_21]